MTEILQQLIDAVNKASPVIWEAYMRQAHFDGVFYSAVAGLLLIITLVAFMWAVREEPGAALLILATGLMFSGMFAYAGVSRLYNPTYYAIQALLRAVR